VIAVGCASSRSRKVRTPQGRTLAQARRRKPTESGTESSLAINTGIGNDEVSLYGTSFSSTVSINTGAGADVVTIDQLTGVANATFNNNLSITTGEDNDTVSISNTTTKKVSINTGDDDDTINLNTVNAGGTLSIQAGAGADDLNLNAVTETQAGSNVLGLGTGADDVVIASSSFAGNVSIDLGTGIVNTLTIDDTAFNGTFSLAANGSVGLNGVGDVINIETDTSLLGATTFAKTAKMKVGAAADINLGVLNLASTTHYQSSVSISGINPAADLTVALANNTFFSVPTLTKVTRVDI